MNISLDYDGTYTEDPEMWDAFILNSRLRGHKVYCITMRFNNENEAGEVNEKLLDKVDAIIYTGRKGKKQFLQENTDIWIDVWIDDMPEFIGTSALS